MSATSVRRALVFTLVTLALLGIAACAATVQQPVSSPASSDESTTTPEPAEEATVPRTTEGAALLPQSYPPFSVDSWSTDFTRRTVEWEEILSGGPPKDGIPSIDEPTFESTDAASDWLSARDPIIFFEHEGDLRGYPLAILIWHEIVNDVVGGLPVAVTFCPLCNASIVFDSSLDGEALDFGTTGKLRNSDLIMYDRQSETWWQQFTGQGIVGEHAGRQLDFLPSQVLSFADFAAEFPDASVLARPPAARSYGNNPYVGYDSGSDRPFLFNGELDSRLQPTERVVGLDVGGVAMAYPFSAVADAGAINDEIDGLPVVVFHKAGTASALDDRDISESRDIGSTAVYDRRVGDQTLTFSANGDGTFSDTETGSTWNILGQATDGDLAGSELTQVLAFDHFWFAWSAFFPETLLHGDGS